MSTRESSIDARRRAQRRAVAAAGGDPERPPLEQLEAPPLVALAIEAMRRGLAGMSGSIETRDGIVVLVDHLELTSPGGNARIGSDGLLDLPPLPASVVASLPGRTLGAAFAMPTGREDLDRAVSALRVAEARATDRGCRIRVEAAKVVPVIEAQRREREWMDMEPTPTAR